MTCATANRDYTIELLRAELIHRIEKGDRSARKLLSGLAQHQGQPVSEMIEHHSRLAGPLFLEKILFHLGMLSLGLAFGILVLTAVDLIQPELSSLGLSIGAFLMANASLVQYGKHSKSRFFVTEFTQLLAKLGAHGQESRFAA